MPNNRQTTDQSQRHGWIGSGLSVLILLQGAPLALRANETTYADVAPILARHCVLCHAGPAAPRGLRLDSAEAVLAGSDRGPVVVPGDPAASELLRRIRGDSLPRMPMTGPPYLSEQETGAIESWIAGGARPPPAAVMPAGQAGEASKDEPTAAPAVPARSPGETVTWVDVAPVFARHCAKCHTDNGLMGDPPEGLRLTSYESVLATRERARVVPNRPLASELVRRIRGWARPRMPLDGPPWLDEATIELIERWIEQGARASDGTPAAIPAGARVRLHGRLDANLRLDGLPLEIGASTRLDDDAIPGSYVRVRGRILDDGSIAVMRIQDR